MKGLNVVFVPWLGHGHVTPHFELARKLSKCKTTNFHIHFCSTLVILDFLKKTKSKELSDAPNIKLVPLQLPSPPELPPHLHSARGLPWHLWPILVKSYQNAGSSFSDVVNEAKPDLIIYDFLQDWAPKIALSRGIPAIQLLVESAPAVSYYYHLYVNDTLSNYPFPELFIPDYTMEHLRMQAQTEANTTSISKYFEELYNLSGLQNSTDIVLANQWEEPERKYIDYVESLCKKRVVAVGPLVAQSETTISTDEHESDDFKEIMQWLDSKSPFSTVYATFGSECLHSKEDIQEIAHGLELSGANFLWVVKPPEGEKMENVEEILPQGFFNRIKGRGLVVTKWVPHAKIMSHSSIGGFLNHCGWNSTLECMHFGVPLIAMPVLYDQYIVAKYVIGLGTAVEISKTETGKVNREEMSKIIRNVIADKKGEELREKAKQLSLKMRKEEAKDIDGMVKELLKLCS